MAPISVALDFVNTFFRRFIDTCREIMFVNFVTCGNDHVQDLEKPIDPVTHALE